MTCLPHVPSVFTRYPAKQSAHFAPVESHFPQLATVHCAVNKPITFGEKKYCYTGFKISTQINIPDQRQDQLTTDVVDQLIFVCTFRAFITLTAGKTVGILALFCNKIDLDLSAYDLLHVCRCFKWTEQKQSTTMQVV